MQHERCEEYRIEDLIIIERKEFCEVCKRTTDHQGETGPCIRCLARKHRYIPEEYLAALGLDSEVGL